MKVVERWHGTMVSTSELWGKVSTVMRCPTAAARWRAWRQPGIRHVMAGP